MSERQKKKRAPEVPEPEDEASDDETVDPADLGDSETLDADQRTPPDPQLNRREQGLPPDQEAVERAREHSPPLNPDLARDVPFDEN